MKLLALLDHSERYRLAHENLNEQNEHIELKSYAAMVIKTPLNDQTTILFAICHWRLSHPVLRTKLDVHHMCVQEVKSHI